MDEMKKSIKYGEIIQKRGWLNEKNCFTIMFNSTSVGGMWN